MRVSGLKEATEMVAYYMSSKSAVRWFSHPLFDEVRDQK